MKKVFVLRLVKILSLLLAVLLLVSLAQTWLFKPLEKDPWRMEGFRLEAKDSLDVLLLGASEVYTGFSSAYAYELEGFTSYPFAIAACPVTQWKTMLEYALDSQTPQLIVIEINGVSYRDLRELHSNVTMHYLLDSMPLSVRKMQLAFGEQRRDEIENAEYYLFPLLKYHAMSMDVGSLEENYNNMKAIRQRGYAMLRGVSSVPAKAPTTDEIRDISNDFSEQDLAEEAEQSLREFLEYCRGSKLNVLFTRFPHQIGCAEHSRIYESFQVINRAERIIIEYGFPVLNMERMTDEIGIVWEQDFYNGGHLNIYGQNKVTEFLSRYLVEECGIIPRAQSTENISKWEESAEYYRLYCDYVKEMTEKRIQDPEQIAESAELDAILNGRKDLDSTFRRKEA